MLNATRAILRFQAGVRRGDHLARGQTTAEPPQAGLDFALAATVFADPFAVTVTVFDRVEVQEERWHTIGTLFTGGTFKVVVVVHIFPGGDEVEWVHIISMRPADAGERRRYE